ncbi:cell wall-binding repeat-containing protein [Mahella australiensis]|uniref:Transglutaminase domain-containing protein n=1 Tax=Mahella australiensis (strain DSM 15567 / CIP 107919 / 50-1 BON) TaxID=697281 RepID=F3ZWX2_MAHA5|nr:cell wall-binding repeat-containing protein [Mahella australiensis]AEE97594.1 transglutaminase domain-containing protein [Mahella australiensis 50-1 BON]
MQKKIIAIIVVIAVMVACTVTVSAAGESTYTRLAGADRYATCAEISKAGWDSAGTVVIACGDDFPDGLAGGPLAYKFNAPLLLVQKDKIPASITSEIKRLKPQKAYVLGGPDVVSNTVVSELHKYGISIERVYGDDRAATAAEIAKITGATGGKAIIATGLDYPDALAVSPIAAKNGWPILFAYNNILPEATADALLKLGIKEVDIIGGPDVVGNSAAAQIQNMGIHAKRIYGDNRYITALNIAKRYSTANNGIFMVTGADFADALSTAPLAAQKSPVLLLAAKDSVEPEVRAFAKEKGISRDMITVIGGTDVVSETAVERLFTGDTVELYNVTVDIEGAEDPLYVVHFSFQRPVPYTFLSVRLKEDPNGQPVSYLGGASTYQPTTQTVSANTFISEEYKGTYWFEIVLEDDEGNEIMHSTPVKIELSGIEEGLIYTSEQLLKSVADGIEPKISPDAQEVLALYNKAKDIVSSIVKPGMSDLQKEKAIHDYVVNNTKYDKENYDNNTIPQESYDAYGALVKNTAVCQGYAEATSLLLNMAGIENIIVSGDANNGITMGGHAWNIVKIDGKYYHLDTTWDDPVTSDGHNVLTYNYFNLSDSEIGKNHFWEKSQYPACPDTGPRPSTTHL